MKWIKSWTQELDSTLMQEGSIPDRYIFFSLRLLAGRQDLNGKIKYLNNAHLARMINVPADILEISLNFLCSTKRVQIKHFSGFSILTICKWHIYQQPNEMKMESQNQGKTGKMESPKIRLDKIRKEEKKRDGQNKFDPLFETFWKIYPTRIDKQESKGLFLALAKTEKDFAKDIIQATKGYVNYLLDQHTQGFKQEPMHPPKFLRDGKWREYINYPPHKPPL